MTETTSKNGSKNRDSVSERIAAFLLPPVAWVFCRVIGFLTWHLTSRRDIAIRNVALAFPERDTAWHRRIAHASVMRMIEMFTLPLVLPFLGEQEIRRRFVPSQESFDAFAKVLQNGPAVMQTHHCSMSESLVTVPLFYPGVRITTVYRPLDFRPADRLVLRARQHWGMKLLSRKDGLLGLRKALADGESVGIFFDQNALTAGALIMCFGRVCTATDLPGILAAKLHIPCYLVHTRRTGFMRAQFDLFEIASDGSAADITVRSCLRLEKILREDDNACADWMWAHRRWNSFHARAGASALNLEAHRDYLPQSLAAMGLSELPRRQPFCLRMPANPELAKIAAGWLPRLRAARPDVRWIVVSHAAAAPNFHEGENCEKLVTYSRGGIGSALASIRSEYPQIYFSLEADSDLVSEAEACHAEYKVGISTRTAYRKVRKVAFIAAPERLEKDAFDALLADFFAYCGLRSAASPAPSAKDAGE